MIRFYLGEEPILENVTTYLLDDPELLEHVLARIDELVFKPTGESGGRGVMIGPHAERGRDRAHARGLIEATPSAGSPRRWCGSRRSRRSDRTGVLRPRHVDLRPFAVFGERIGIVPGGLTRVALEEGSMIVNSSRGGGSKDTWVLEDDDGDEPARARRSPTRSRRRCPTCARRVDRPAAAAAAADSSSRALMLARIAHELFWLGRNVSRAEFTARTVDGVFQADLQGPPEAVPSVSFGSGGVLAMLGEAPRERATPRADGRCS